MNLQPIPADPPIGGPFWSLIVPILVFGGSLASTYLLFRHFARAAQDDDNP